MSGKAYAWDDNGVAIDHTKLVPWNPNRTQEQLQRLLAAADKLRFEGNYEKAMQGYLKVENLLRVSHFEGDFLAFVHYGMAEVLRLTEHPVEALKLYTEALEFLNGEGYPDDHPSKTDMFVGIASTYEELGNYSEAIKNYEKAFVGRKKHEGPEYIYAPGHEATVAVEEAITRVRNAQEEHYRP